MTDDGNSAFSDLLFGGLSADLLFSIAPDRAGAMDEGDLIASDLTAWEHDPNLLASIFHRRNSSDSYADRLQNLRYCNRRRSTTPRFSTTSPPTSSSAARASIGSCFSPPTGSWTAKRVKKACGVPLN